MHHMMPDRHAQREVEVLVSQPQYI